jgi:hypothetical protein
MPAPEITAATPAICRRRHLRPVTATHTAQGASAKPTDAPTPASRDERQARRAAERHGRVSHVALENDGEISVFDIWESQADFDAFGETLLPILSAAGIELNPPMVMQVHNTIDG